MLIYKDVNGVLKSIFDDYSKVKSFEKWLEDEKETVTELKSMKMGEIVPLSSDGSSVKLTKQGYLYGNN